MYNLHYNTATNKADTHKLVSGTCVDKGDIDLSFQIGSETCVSALNEDITVCSQVISPATGISSFMNCVGIGFPVLTFNFQVNKSFLKKHKLKLNCIYTLSSSREILLDAMKLYGHQLRDYPIYSGGSTLDIARIAQVQAKTVVFLGALAMDEDALTLIDLCKATRLGIRMQEVGNGRTSILLVLHYKKRWCEVCFTDQLVHLSASYIDRPVITKILERTSIIYTTELSILLMPRVFKMVAYFCLSRFKHFVTVLHNSQCMIEGKDSLLNILCYTDILFLTPESAKKFLKVFHVPFLCKQAQAWDIYLWMKSFSQRSCTVIVSDGLKRAYVHTDLCHKMSSKYKSTYYKHITIVDYYGVARAFVGGFMAMMIGGFQVDPCVECGFFCASLIAGRVGMTLPEDREMLVHKWYAAIECVIQHKGEKMKLGKRESNMPFTIFQTPWKELETNAYFTERYKNM